MQASPQRACPNCQKLISAAASRCMYCWNAVLPIPGADARSAEAPMQAAPTQRQCPNCRKVIPAAASLCMYCAKEVPPILRTDAHDQVQHEVVETPQQEAHAELTQKCPYCAESI